MSSSELSNALNPYVVQTRSRSLNNNAYQSHLQPVVQPPQQHVPHRSELELAIAEPAPPQPPRCVVSPALTFSISLLSREVTVRPRNSGSPAGAGAVHELLRMLAATKEAQEIERKRRIAWEQEQEAKFAQRQAEMERQLLEMKQEIQILKGTAPSTNISQPDLARPPANQTASLAFPAIVQQPSPQLSESSTPVSLHGRSQPAFVQGSSSRPIQPPHTSAVIPDDATLTPFSPQFIAMDGLDTQSEATRRSPELVTSEKDSQEDSDSSGDSSDNGSPPPRSSRHRYNGRCLTIQVRFALCVLIIGR